MPDDASDFVPPVVHPSEPAARPPSVWRALLDEPVRAGGAVPWLAPEALDHLGDPDGERVDLVAGRPVAVPRLARGHLRVQGGDRVDFVQGQVSQDVRGLGVGGAADALLLDHKGRPQAGMTVYRRADDLYLAVEDGAGPAVLRALQDHVVFDQVTLGDVAEGAVGARGLVACTLLAADLPLAVDALRSAFPALDGDAVALDRALLVPLDDAGATRVLLRFVALGPLVAVDVTLLAGDLAEAWHALRAAGVRPVGERALTAARVAHGVATVRGEGALGLPQETGLADRVHPRKGCYLGQEIMARVEARGQLRRTLVGLALDGPPPALGLAQAWRIEDASGATVGALGSAAPALDGEGWWALAVARRDAIDRAVDEPGFPWRVRAPDDVPPLGPDAVAAKVR
jgi:folate-binding protein YgfZ